MEESEHGFRLVKPAGDESLANMTELEDGRRVFAEARERLLVPGYHGGEVPSSRPFLAFRFWFENAIESLDGSPRVWNCTEGGARIEGTRQLPLAEALPRLTATEVDPGAVLDERLAGFDAAARRARMGEHLESLLAGFERCISAAVACRAAARAASAGGEALAELERCEARLRESLAPLRLLSVVGQHEISMAVDRARRATDLAGNLAAATSLFEVVERNARTLGGPVREALERLRD